MLIFDLNLPDINTLLCAPLFIMASHGRVDQILPGRLKLYLLVTPVVVAILRQEDIPRYIIQ